MEQLASILMHSRTQSHVFHLRMEGPKAYEFHKALNTYYDDVVDLIDTLVEGYQGKNGVIEFKAVKGIDNNATPENVISYFDKLIAIVDKLRKEESLSDSFLQNEIDNVVNLLYSTRYKLINLG
jgi:DNA-binding ferritin-like protein